MPILSGLNDATLGRNVPRSKGGVSGFHFGLGSTMDTNSRRT